MSESLLRVFGLLIGIAIPLASFVTGLRAEDPLWLWKRPRLLGKALLSILIVVPLLAAVLLEVLSPENVLVRAGVMVSIFAIGIGPPDLSKRTETATTTTRYEIGLEVALLPIAIFFVPLAIAIHGAVFHHELFLSSWQVAKVVLMQALLPFAAGVGVARLWPRIVASVEPYAEVFVKLAMLVVVIFALAIAWRPMIELGAFVWLTCGVIAMMSILIGHALGGPQPETRSMLASFSAMRFPGLALLIVSVVPRGERLLPAVLAYVLASAALVGAYRAARPKAVKPEVHRTGLASGKRQRPLKISWRGR